MIQRYCLPQMKSIWSDENKFAKWLEVEIAVCEAWAKTGTIPTFTARFASQVFRNLTDGMNFFLPILTYDK